MKLHQRVKHVCDTCARSENKLAQLIGVPQRNLNRYLNEKSQHNLWELLPRILKLYPQISRDWLYFGEGEMLKQPRQYSALELCKMVPTPDIDRDALKCVVTTLEEMLSAAGKTLPPEAKAEVICQLYQIIIEQEGKAGNSALHIARAISGIIASTG